MHDDPSSVNSYESVSLNFTAPLCHRPGVTGTEPYG